MGIMVAALNYVWFWPDNGRRDKPWPHSYGGVDYSAEDAFLRTSRRVTERYSEALAENRLETRSSRSSSLDMGVNQYRSDDETVSVRLGLTRPGENGVGVDIPANVATLAAQDRARLVLDVVDLAMRTIGDVLDWPLDVLDRAHQHTLDHGLGFSMAGPWKTTGQVSAGHARSPGSVTKDGASSASRSSMHTRTRIWDTPQPWSAP